MNLDGTEVNLPEGEDHALQALRSEDPAIGMTQPDLVAIREKVDTSDLAEVSSLSEHATRATRFPRWSYAAAAAVLLVGVGGGTGYAISAKSHTPLGTPSLGAYCGEQDANCNDTGLSGQISAMCAEGNPDCNDTPGTLEGTSSQYAAGKTSDMMASSIAWNYRPWLTPADSLSDKPGSSRAYILSSKGLDRSAAVKNLIDAFDIGPHKIRHRSAKDGTRVIENGTRATVALDAQDSNQAHWYYDNPDNGQYACEEGYGELPREDSSAPCKIKTGERLSDSQAIAVAKEIFGTVGLDLANVTWATNSGKEYFGVDANNKPQPYVQVIARMTLDGREIEGLNSASLQWAIELAPDKSVVHASGMLAKPVQVPDYEIVGAKTAVLRSQDPIWSVAYGPEPIYSSGQGFGYRGNFVPNRTSATQNLDDQGRPLLQVDLQQVEITEAELGFAGFNLSGDSYAILPVYKLTGGDRSWIQIAVADKYLQVK